MGSESGKRDADRVLILGDLKGEIMVFEPLQIREISPGGASVETRFPLALDSLHDVRLTLGSTSIVVKARVAHSRISEVDQEIVTYRSGIEFIEPSERVSEVISEYLEMLKAHRSGV
jgi:PilZ domain-containing protein